MARILKKDMHRQIWANIVGGFVVVAILLYAHKKGWLMDAN